jgi:hypothetical protein
MKKDLMLAGVMLATVSVTISPAMAENRHGSDEQMFGRQ